MGFWLVKSEPEVYAYAALVEDGRTAWTGVRSAEARNNLNAMKVGEKVLFYHSQSTKDVVGLAEVAAEAYPDPTAEGDPRWVVVDLVPVAALPKPVTLATMKADEALSGMAVVKKSRLSVTPVSEAEYRRVLALGGLGEAS